MDSEIRRLERAAASGDMVAGRSLAAIHERAGDRRSAFAVLARLARLGDAESVTRVAAWTPWPSAKGAGSAQRSRRPGARRDARTVEVSRPGVGVVAGATDALVYWHEPNEMTALDARTLEPRFAIATPGGTRGAVLAGDDLVLDVGGDFVVFGGGAEIARRPGLGAMPRNPSRLEVGGDRLVRVGETGMAIDGVPALEGRVGAFVVTSQAVFAAEDGLRALDLETRGTLWRGAGLPRAADERGVLVHEGEGARELDAATGRERWHYRCILSDSALGGEVAVLEVERPHRLVGVARDSGKELWSIRPEVWESIVLADDVCYLGWSGRRAQVVALDLATGSVLFDRPLREAAGCELVSLVPLEKALVLAYRPRHLEEPKTVLLRLEE